MSEAVQRIRIRFRKGERVRHISHLDVLRYWERAIRRADLPLLYSQGFTPHPKLAFAAPLPLGFIGEREVLDVTLSERVALRDLARQLAGQTAPDLDLGEAAEVGLGQPAPPVLLRWADYRANFEGVDPGEASEAVARFLASETFPWRREREGKKALEYDLREAVASLELDTTEAGLTVSARLRADQDLTVRPEQLVEALFPEAQVSLYIRADLVLDEPSAAREAWRKRGQYQG